LVQKLLLLPDNLNFQKAHMFCHRIALAFENLTPIQVCQAFGRALKRPCKYVFDQHIEINVPVPTGYRQQLVGIEILFGQYNAPYFPGAEFRYSSKRKGSNDTITGRGSFSDGRSGSMPNKGQTGKLTDEARGLWEGWRGMEVCTTASYVMSTFEN
jgi:hypothetical protein